MEFYLEDGGVRLHCRLDRPGEAPGPLVIVLHGITGHMEEPHLVELCRTMHGCGCATLRAELYGHGQSGGLFREHNLFRWLNNSLAVIDYARGLDFVTKLVLCGHSQGGLTAMLAAGMKHEVIDALILLSPAAMIPAAARRGQFLGQSFDPRQIPDELPMGEDGVLSGNYLRVAQTIFVAPSIDRYDGPVLLIHGDADETVPLSVGSETAARYHRCRMCVIPGDTHCYDRHLDRVCAVVKSWLGG